MRGWGLLLGYFVLFCFTSTEIRSCFHKGNKICSSILFLVEITGLSSLQTWALNFPRCFLFILNSLWWWEVEVGTRGSWWFFHFVLMVIGWGWWCLREVSQKQWLWNNKVSKESISRFSTLRLFYNFLNIWYKITGYSVVYISVHTYP